jgi:ATP dependent DNA ligase domain
VHEIKHDGYRLIVRREAATVRLFTRRGYDSTERYPAIAGAAAKLKARSFTLDGEAVVCGADGVAVFDASTGAAVSPMPSYRPSTCSSWTASTTGRCRSAGARIVWRGYWPACRSPSTSTPTKTAPCSATMAGGATELLLSAAKPRQH